jgi:hypothetical protein
LVDANRYPDAKIYEITGFATADNCAKLMTSMHKPLVEAMMALQVKMMDYDTPVDIWVANLLGVHIKNFEQQVADQADIDKDNLLGRTIPILDKQGADVPSAFPAGGAPIKAPIDTTTGNKSGYIAPSAVARGPFSPGQSTPASQTIAHAPTAAPAAGHVLSPTHTPRTEPSGTASGAEKPKEPPMSEYDDDGRYCGGFD